MDALTFQRAYGGNLLQKTIIYINLPRQTNFKEHTNLPNHCAQQPARVVSRYQDFSQME
jgi:hypothetical protein